jgi:hypothetical protein
MEILDEPSEQVNEDHIRHRAYMLWLEEGEPEGRAEEYWHRACAVVEANDGVPPAELVEKTK